MVDHFEFERALWDPTLDRNSIAARLRLAWALGNEAQQDEIIGCFTRMLAIIGKAARTLALMGGDTAT